MSHQSVPGVSAGPGHRVRHQSALAQVTGTARYVDDYPLPAGGLSLVAVLSPHAHARILDIDLSACLAVSGVVRVFGASDVTGNGDIGSLAPGEPLFAHPVAEYAGQIILTVAATSYRAAQQGAAAVHITWQPLEAVLDVEQALRGQYFVEPPHTQQRGDPGAALENARQDGLQRVQGQLSIGGQEHLYLETQSALALPEENDQLTVYASTQNPTEVQKKVAAVLGIKSHQVVVEVPRMGGGFGGKETQAAAIACHAALAASLTGRPVKMCLSREDDMRITGKRHPFTGRYDVAFSAQGVITALAVDLLADCGFALDLSGSVCDRAMFHADNAYFIPHMRVTGYRCKTHRASNTAFRGFGAPQGIAVIEAVMDRIARICAVDPLLVRQRNFYQQDTRNTTHYGQKVQPVVVQHLVGALRNSAGYDARRTGIQAFNREHRTRRRGMALTPLKFGIAFTSSFLNQAGALLLIYSDGTVQVNHGGTEMGQGLHTKMAQIVAGILHISLADIRVMPTRTDKVPNTSPTAASSGTDLNGKAVENAALILRDRLVDLLCRLYHCRPEQVLFQGGRVRLPGDDLPFSEVARQAWLHQVSLSASGFYRVPGVHYDRQRGQGQPFNYFVWGAACSEVEICLESGEYRVLRTDILYDAGHSLNPALDRGQIEGGFIQGMGWVTREQLAHDPQGRLLTCNPATYKVPLISDIPADFRVHFYAPAPECPLPETPGHAKAVGEPPFILGLSVWAALQDAISSLQPGDGPVLPIPATHEQVFMAMQTIRQQDPHHEQ